MAFNPGGGGAIAGATDVTLDSPQDNEVLAYDSGSAKWQNQTGSGGSLGAYSVTVYQDGGQTIARRRDGSVVDSRASGSAGDALVIQAAIDDVEGTPSSTYGGGGTVFLTAGRYMRDRSIVLKYGVDLVGEGAHLDDKGAGGLTGAVIDTAAGVNQSALVVGVAASGNRVADNPHHTLIRDIGLRGIGNSSGILSRDTRYLRVVNCVIKNFNKGIENISSLPPDEGGLTHNYLENFIQGCGVGIETTGIGATDGIISGGRILSCPTSINLRGGGGWQLHGIHMTHNKTNPSHCILETDNAEVTNCYFDSGTGPLLECIATSWVVITGCYFLLTGEGNSHIKVGTKTNISGNTFGFKVDANPRGLIEVGSGGAWGIYANNWGGPVGGAFVSPVVTPSGAAVASGTSRAVANNETY